MYWVEAVTPRGGERYVLRGTQIQKVDEIVENWAVRPERKQI